MRRPRYFESSQALPRMAWNSRNLYNLWSRSVGPHHLGKHKNNITRFQDASQSLFKQRWQSKKLVRAYHCDYVPEKKFIRWYLPERLPDPMAKSKANVAARVEDNWARQQTKRAAPEGETGKDQLAPISSLMFAELERRIDVVVFRSCFAHSIHAARQMVVHGKVTLNGLKESDPNTRLNPGDMISVNPDAMTILTPPKGFEAAAVDTPSENKDDVAPETEASSSASADTPKTSKPRWPRKISVGSQSKPQVFASNPSEPAFALLPYAAPFIFIPAYLEVSFSTCSAIYVRHPTARPQYSEIPSPFDADGEIVRFAWEWYRKNRTRIRGSWKQGVREKMEKGKSGWSGV